MTREEARERAEVMLAFAAGKDVQFFNRMSGQWDDIPGEVLFDSTCEYRVKPNIDFSEPSEDGEQSVGRLNKYQMLTLRTWCKPLGIDALPYLTLALNGEVGELTEKVKKLYRDHYGELTPQMAEGLALELGDALWYLSVLAHTIGYSLKDIADMNIKKVTSRDRRNKIHGDGDYR